MAPINDSALEPPQASEAEASLEKLKRGIANCSGEQKGVLLHYLIRLIFPDLDAYGEVALNDSDELTYAFVMSARRWAELVNLPARFDVDACSSEPSANESECLFSDVLELMEKASSPADFAARQAQLRSPGR